MWAILNPVAKGYAGARRALERACRDAELPAPHIVLTTAAGVAASLFLIALNGVLLWLVLTGS